MKFKFTKMQGTGNDYVYVNAFTEKLENPAQVAITVSDRHFGIGSDGLILVAPSEVADCRMIMYNADGSVRSKLFNKKIISESEWLYEAYFQHAVDGCYIIEYVPDGYSVYYENVGEYAHVTDRCYNGGTIINRKVPQTSDPLPIGVHVICMLAAGTGLILLRKTSRKQRVE